MLIIRYQHAKELGLNMIPWAYLETVVFHTSIPLFVLVMLIYPLKHVQAHSFSEKSGQKMEETLP